MRAKSHHRGVFRGVGILANRARRRVTVAVLFLANGCNGFGKPAIGPDLLARDIAKTCGADMT